MLLQSESCMSEFLLLVIHSEHLPLVIKVVRYVLDYASGRTKLIGDFLRH